MGATPPRATAGRADPRPRPEAERHVGRTVHRAAVPRAGRSTHHAPPALLAVGRMVLAEQRAGHRHPVLPRAPAARPARAEHDAGGRGSVEGRVHADPAARSGARDAAWLPTAPPAELSEAVREVLDALPQVVSAETREPALRPSPARVLRTGASRRGLRGDLRRVDAAPRAVAEA